VVSDLVAFLAVSALVIVTPGQDTALTIRNTVVGGRRGGILTALGVATGQFTWTVATSAGIVAVLVASEPAFLALKLAGAAYLAFLGAQALWGAFRADDTTTGLSGADRLGMTASAAFRQGLMSNLGNPKMVAFFTSLLPQFMPAGEASFSALLLLGLVFCGLTLTWLTAYAFAVAKARDALRRPAIRRVLDGVTGIVLIALGIRLASQQR
jgi:threonine/homoserine/homoserine lactone efflux protein